MGGKILAITGFTPNALQQQRAVVYHCREQATLAEKVHQRANDADGSAVLWRWCSRIWSMRLSDSSQRRAGKKTSFEQRMSV